MLVYEMYIGYVIFQNNDSQLFFFGGTSGPNSVSVVVFNMQGIF